VNEKDRRNIDMVRRMYEGELAEGGVISPDIIWHVPGHNPVSGTYEGIDAYANQMTGRMAPLTQWDFELERVMPNGDMVVATFRVQGERKGRTVDLQGVHVMRLDGDGQVVEGWGFTDDQDALDEFFSA
jgi:ketosteroid isomerase-like protein